MIRTKSCGWDTGWWDSNNCSAHAWKPSVKIGSCLQAPGRKSAGWRSMIRTLLIKVNSCAWLSDVRRFAAVANLFLRSSVPENASMSIKSHPIISVLSLHFPLWQLSVATPLVGLDSSLFCEGKQRFVHCFIQNLSMFSRQLTADTRRWCSDTTIRSTFSIWCSICKWFGCCWLPYLASQSWPLHRSAITAALFEKKWGGNGNVRRQQRHLLPTSPST